MVDALCNLENISKRCLKQIGIERSHNYEGLPGVLGNKGTWPFIFGEQGCVKITFREQRNF